MRQNILPLLFLTVVTGCANMMPQSDYETQENAQLQQIQNEVNKMQASQQAAKERAQKAREDYVNSHPEISQRLKDAILNRKVFVGMTSDQVRLSWGEPYYGINKTTTADHVSEQWVYNTENGTYLYFEDGILTTIQSPGN